MGPVAILLVYSKDLIISPRFTPYEFLSRCKFSTLTTRQLMVAFYLRSQTYRYGRHKKYPALTRIELTASALAGMQVTYQTTPATRAQTIYMRVASNFPNSVQNRLIEFQLATRFFRQQFTGHLRSSAGSSELLTIRSFFQTAVR